MTWIVACSEPATSASRTARRSGHTATVRRIARPSSLDAGPSRAPTLFDRFNHCAILPRRPLTSVTVPDSRQPNVSVRTVEAAEFSGLDVGDSLDAQVYVETHRVIARALLPCLAPFSTQDQLNDWRGNMNRYRVLIEPAGRLWVAAGPASNNSMTACIRRAIQQTTVDPRWFCASTVVDFPELPMVWFPQKHITYIRRSVGIDSRTPAYVFELRNGRVELSSSTALDHLEQSLLQHDSIPVWRQVLRSL